MTSRTLADARRWTAEGTALFAKTADLSAVQLASASLLPGWTRAHVVAHVAANAEALGNLVRWAATGEPTPMYASPQERLAGIERGSRLPAAELARWLSRTADRLDAAMSELTDEQWQAPVVTNSGRTVPATETAWMRAREVYVHAVDLGTGVAFAELPADFLAGLCDDVIAKRGTGTGLVLAATDTAARWELAMAGAPVTVEGPLAEITAYLTGRPHRLGPAPALSAWL